MFSLGSRAGGPAVEQLAPGGVARDGHDVRAVFQEGGQQPVPAFPALGDGLLDELHGLAHVPEIAAHGVRDLGDGLGAARAGALDHGAPVAVEKEQDTAQQVMATVPTTMVTRMVVMRSPVRGALAFKWPHPAFPPPACA